MSTKEFNYIHLNANPIHKETSQNRIPIYQRPLQSKLHKRPNSLQLSNLLQFIICFTKKTNVLCYKLVLKSTNKSYKYPLFPPPGIKILLRTPCVYLPIQTKMDNLGFLDRSLRYFRVWSPGTPISVSNFVIEIGF